MTDHYGQADQHLAGESFGPNDQFHNPPTDYTLRMAQVHATLALVDAVRDLRAALANTPGASAMAQQADRRRTEGM